MSIEIQCMTEKLIVITIKLDYSKVPSKSTVPTYTNNKQNLFILLVECSNEILRHICQLYKALA